VKKLEWGKNQQCKKLEAELRKLKSWKSRGKNEKVKM
jgi:hypothetical protein